MVNALIFSKDRAAQLDLLLRSIEKNTIDLFSSIVVLYTYSNEEYKEGYERLISNLRGYRPLFVKEEDFRQDTLDFCENTKYVSLLTDDTVFFRPFEFDFSNELVLKFLNEVNSVFSLRLGYNTVVQNIHANPVLMQPYLHFVVEKDGILSWNPKFYRSTYNYGYPFSIDAHIYHTEFLYDLMKQIPFKNTNQLESGLFQYHQIVNKMYSLNHSVAVNIPCNNLSNITVAGQYYPFTTKELNDAFLEGKRILLDTIERADIAGCHQEEKLVLE